MSEYQRYEFITIDKPLTREQLNEVKNLSSHIEVSSTHAIVEYSWGSFKHNPITVLREFFDGFLHCANWGSRQLAFRFPHGILPANLLNDYDFEDFVELIQYQDYDILNIKFSHIGASYKWIDYELGPLLPIRQELMDGDLRSLYIVWLAARYLTDYDNEDEDYYDEEDYDEEDEDEDEDEDYEEVKGKEDEEVKGEEDERDVAVPPVPPGLKQLTSAQSELAKLLQVSPELLVAAAQHSTTTTVKPDNDFAAWIELLPENRRKAYLLRLAHNEPGLSHQLVRELRDLGRVNKTADPEGEHVTFATLFAESTDIKERREREQREQEQLARQRHLQDVHKQQQIYWKQIDQMTKQAAGANYDTALGLLVDLRDAAEYFQESQQFQTRFNNWVVPLLRRPALIKRLKDHHFIIP
jgi:hypothetical protein